MARPKNDTPSRLMQFRCPEPMAEWVEADAERRGLTVSAWFRRVIERAGYEQQPTKPGRRPPS